MALKDAGMEVASQMEKLAGVGPGSTGVELRTFALALKIAVKAAEGQPDNPIGSLVLGTSNEAASLQNAKMIEQAREEFRKGKHQGSFQESVEARMVIAVGGPEDGTSVPCAHDMPVGAKCMLGDSVYELRADGQLHHVE